MYIPHLALTSIRTSITLVHVQSSDHLITRAIQSRSLYNCPYGGKIPYIARFNAF